MDSKELAKYIDHTLLKAEATSAQIKQLCKEAKEHGFAAVSINSRWVPMAADLLARSGVKVGAVVSLPLGGDSTKAKVAAAREAILDGADEIDMVADLASIIDEDGKFFAKQLRDVKQVCHAMRPPVTFKVILETAVLTQEQKIFACHVASLVCVDFVKTSTGMHPAGGATIEDVKLMTEYAPNCKVKAAGGIRTAQQALAMIEAGADRIGTSAGVQIIEQLNSEQG
ncbi:MAG: deoxyribose-phosphate aldolase [Planctomycetes bacterium]|nr:deoxyribose-phosphate aldolase [Planctomycetota bacterium]